MCGENRMKQVIIAVVAAVILFGGYMMALEYFIVYLPSQEPLADGHQYKYITEWMEGEDAHHYLPTINKAMEDGVMQEFEYDTLRGIEDALTLSREKAKFELSFDNHPHTDHSY